ncbi:MAG: LemA family protein [Candidatus Gracilibacteria bacterium]|nr:LemA family protein [Candidatus Gracilibacteria bacterium]
MEWIILSILIGVLIIGIIAYLFLIVLYHSKLNLLEKRIKILFEKRTNLIPAFYQVTKQYVDKHEMVFSDIIYLKKMEMFNTDDYNFHEFLALEAKIHHELNFIFKVLKPIKKVEKNGKFLYIRDLLDETSEKIGKQIRIYKIVSSRYNKMLKYKNFTIAGIFLPFGEKDEI